MYKRQVKRLRDKGISWRKYNLACNIPEGRWNGRLDEECASDVSNVDAGQTGTNESSAPGSTAGSGNSGKNNTSRNNTGRNNIERNNTGRNSNRNKNYKKRKK